MEKKLIQFLTLDDLFKRMKNTIKLFRKKEYRNILKVSEHTNKILHPMVIMSDTRFDGHFFHIESILFNWDTIKNLDQRKIKKNILKFDSETKNIFDSLYILFQIIHYHIEILSGVDAILNVYKSFKDIILSIKKYCFNCSIKESVNFLFLELIIIIKIIKQKDF